MTLQTKRKHSETFNAKDLFDLCKIPRCYRNKEERFDLIRQWLNANKDDDNTLKAVITYQGGCNWTPLHLLSFQKPPLDIIQMMIKHAPEVLQMKNTDGQLPIHHACGCGASLEVIQALVNSYPDSIKVEDIKGWLPLHLACRNDAYGASLAVLNFLIESYPEGVSRQDKWGRTPLEFLKQDKYAEKADDNGMLPLHHVCNKGYSDHLIHLLILANPECYKMNDDDGRTPLDYYTSFEGRQLCDEIIELLQPLNKRKSKNPVVSPDSERATAPNAEAPPVEQTETQPSQQRTDENEVEIRNTEINAMKAELKADINEVKSDITEVKADIRQVQLDVLETKAEIINMKNEMSEMKSDLLETKAEILNITTEVSEMKAELLETKAEIVNIKTDVSEIKSMVGDIQRFLRGMISC